MVSFYFHSVSSRRFKNQTIPVIKASSLPDFAPLKQKFVPYKIKHGIRYACKDQTGPSVRYQFLFQSE